MGVPELYYDEDAMPRAHRGSRMPLTIRLPFDLYREVSLRAKARNWSFSDYVVFCVAREVSGKYRPNETTYTARNHEELEWVEEEFVGDE